MKYAMRRSALVMWAVVLLPMLTGFYASCQKNTVGFYPNYLGPNVLFPVHENRTLQAATEADIKGTVLFVHWNKYTSACTRDTAAIQTYVSTYLDKWSAKVAQGGKELNLEIVVPIHLGTPSSHTIGPACKGYTASHYSDPGFQNEFIQYAKIIGDVVSLPKYQDTVQRTGVQVLFGIGNEVDLYLAGGHWANFNGFVSAVRAPIQQNWTGLKPSIGTSVTWLSSSTNNNIGTLNTYTGNWAARISNIRDLFGRTDVMLFTYYAFDAGSGNKALRPDRAAYDLARMAELSRSVGSARGLSYLPVYIQEVGYPTDNSLHGAGGLFYSSGTNGQANQNTFVTNFFDAWYANRTEIRGAAWWSLLDWSASPSESGCTTVWQGLAVPMCTMGLFSITPSSTAPKTAWDTFKTRASDVKNW